MAKKRTKKTKLKGIDAQLATGGLDKALAGGKSRKKGSGAGYGFGSFSRSTKRNKGFM